MKGGAAVLDRLTRALADRYRVERELGAGGMATVYLAHDIKHEREVAIKVLHPDLGAALGGERFLAEIKTTARLQHPHILTLLDSGEADGLLYYVMPFVRGETLRARLERERQLPIADAVRFAREVASALEHAHRQGIIHRDIKPENILLQDGGVLVADFGIALAVQSAGGQRLTQTGLSLGTPSYMSPEQASGERQVDARSDVYALGAITYEMLTGVPPFTGASTAAIVARVLASVPESTRVARATVPVELDEAVLAALAKLPADRPTSAGEFAARLVDRGTLAVDVAAPRKRSTSLVAWVVSAGALIFAGVLGAKTLIPAEVPTAHYRIDLGSGRLFPDVDVNSGFVSLRLAISPDGGTLAYSDPQETDGKLRLKDRSSDVPRVLDGTEGALSVAFAPDGKWIVFSTATGQLKKRELRSGQTVTIANDARTDLNALVWMEDGAIVYGTVQWGIARLTTDGVRHPVKLPEELKAAIPAMSFIPGTQRLLFAACTGNCTYGSDGYLYDLANDSLSMLVPDATGMWYSPTGHLLYTTRDAGLFAVDFDKSASKVVDSPVPVLEGVSPFAFLLSSSGTAVFERETGESDRARELVWVTRDGRATLVDSTWRGQFMYPAIAPDGRTVAVSVQAREADLWLRRADGSRAKVSAPGIARWRARFTGDGSSIYFIAVSRPPRGEAIGAVYRVGADLTQPAELIPTGSTAPAWEIEVSGGRRVLRRGRAIGRIYDFSTDIARLISDDGTVASEFALSPDGRWLAFVSTQYGRSEVYVAEFPTMASRQMVSSGGGLEPRWSASGNTLYFVSGDQLMSTPVTTAGGLRVGQPRPLFSVKEYMHAQNRQHYDVAPDDQRFLMIRLSQSDRRKPLVLVENWLPELRRKLGR